MGDINAIRERHRPQPERDDGIHNMYCVVCFTGWPCDTRVVLADADRLAEALSAIACAPYQECKHLECRDAHEALRQHDAAKEAER